MYCCSLHRNNIWRQGFWIIKGDIIVDHNKKLCFVEEVIPSTYAVSYHSCMLIKEIFSCSELNCKSRMCYFPFQLKSPNWFFKARKVFAEYLEVTLNYLYCWCALLLFVEDTVITEVRQTVYLLHHIIYETLFCKIICDFTTWVDSSIY